MLHIIIYKKEWTPANHDPKIQSVQKSFQNRLEFETHSIVVLWVNQAYFHSYFISPGNKLNELEPCAINSESYFLGTPCRDKNEEKFLRCIFGQIGKCYLNLIPPIITYCCLSFQKTGQGSLLLILRGGSLPLKYSNFQQFDINLSQFDKKNSGQV